MQKLLFLGIVRYGNGRRDAHADSYEIREELSQTDDALTNWR